MVEQRANGLIAHSLKLALTPGPHSWHSLLVLGHWDVWMAIADLHVPQLLLLGV